MPFFSLGIAGPGAAQARAAGTSAHGELIYVANLNNDPVTAYAAGSAGSVAPSLRLDNPNAFDTVWDPWGVASHRADLRRRQRPRRSCHSHPGVRRQRQRRRAAPADDRRGGVENSLASRKAPSRRSGVRGESRLSAAMSIPE